MEVLLIEDVRQVWMGPISVQISTAVPFVGAVAAIGPGPVWINIPTLSVLDLCGGSVMWSLVPRMSWSYQRPPPTRSGTMHRKGQRGQDGQ